MKTIYQTHQNDVVLSLYIYIRGRQLTVINYLYLPVKPLIAPPLAVSSFFQPPSTVSPQIIDCLPKN
jgi:hypothetical protein